MKNQILWWKIRQHLEKKKAGIQAYSTQSEGGFTLIELLVVIIIITVLTATVAPSWFSFINQRRVNVAKDFILGEIQRAQSEAKAKKVSYSVSFRTNNDIPEIAVYPTKKLNGSDTDPDNDLKPEWKNMGNELAIKPKQILVQTNLSGENNAGGGLSNISTSAGSSNKITFDYTGALPPTTTSANLGGSNGLVVSVAAPNGANAIESTKRCVKITTLLGSMTAGRGKYDASTNPEGCP